MASPCSLAPVSASVPATVRAEARACAPRARTLPRTSRLRALGGSAATPWTCAALPCWPAAAAILAGAAVQARSRATGSALRRRRARVQLRAGGAYLPTEYYALLGLPIFTSDSKEIKAAHRRVVKLVHPDITGVSSGALQAIVTEAYTTLSDDKLRAEYNKMLMTAKPDLQQSTWDEGGKGDQESHGVFVDELKCTKCYMCVYCAGNTFAKHTDEYRNEKAFVQTQYGDPREIVDMCVKQCPSKAITYERREDLPDLEYAMVKSCKMLSRAAPQDRKKVPSPHSMIQDKLWDKLVAMDMDKALQDFAEEQDPEHVDLGDAKISKKLTEKSKEILQAAKILPKEVREKVWPLEKDTEDAGESYKGSIVDDLMLLPDRLDDDGMRRTELKLRVFDLLDEDGDGFLIRNEFRKLADFFGFDGNELEWAAEYDCLCRDMDCSPMEGLSVTAFARMVDEENMGCFLSTAELADMVGEMAALPRGRS